MRKITAIIAALVLTLAVVSLVTSCIYIPDNIDTEEFEQKISEVQIRTIEGIRDALDQPLLVVSQTGDTVVSYMPDSVAEGTAVRKITVRVDEPRPDIRPRIAEGQQRLYIVLTVVIIPCVTILLIAIAIMIFISARNRSRNDIISKAIENGYELPESFFSGQNITRVIYENAPAQQPSTSDPTDTASTPGTGAQAPSSMPPLPPLPTAGNRNLHSGIRLAAIGFCILVFFLVVDAPSVAILAGGIPLLLGLGRIASWYYLGKRD